MKKCICIADWAKDQFLVQEVRTIIEGYVQKPEEVRMSVVPCGPYPLEAGYLLAQMVDTEERYGRPLETIIFVSVDPRLNPENSKDPTKGAEFVVLRLVSGLYLCGPNAGHTFSFVHSKIQKVYTYSLPDTISTAFRSRDLYARVCAHLIDNLQDKMDLQEQHTHIIPGYTDHSVGHIDAFGNIQTTIPQSYLKGKHEYEEYCTIRLNGITQKAMYRHTLFGGSIGELIISAGPTQAESTPYLQIAVWQDFSSGHASSAADIFKHPRPGMLIQVS